MVVTSNESLLEPFGTNQRDGQIHKQEHADGRGDIDHRAKLLDVLAGDQKGVAKQHRSGAEQKRYAHPNRQVHRVISPETLFVSTSHAVSSVTGYSNKNASINSGHASKRN